MTIDDWREETQERLKKSSIFRILKTKCDNDPSGSQVLTLVDETTYFAYQKTKAILRHMGEFTLHDGDHLFRVLHLMERLLTVEVIEKLSVPELMLLILSAFFHDIGMAPDEKSVLSWRKVWDASVNFDDELDKKEYELFKRYCSARPEENLKIELFASQGKFSDADMVKSYLIVDYIRNTHADRAKSIIKKHWEGKIKYRDTDLTSEFAVICHSHNEDPLSLLKLDNNYLCGLDIFACLPLIGVILRLADLLDFDAKRTPDVLYSHLFVRHPVSLTEWKKHRTTHAWTINNKLIQYSAKCEHPVIEKSIHDFCTIIDKELSVCNNIITSINDFNRSKKRDLSINIPFQVDRSKIETKKDIDGNPIYRYRETQFNLSKKHVIDLLMGTKLYGDPEVALRELIQNSIDACLLRAAQESSWGNHYIPEIKVKYDVGNGVDILEIIDNGTGMDQKIIDSYYTKVGSSFYKSAEFYDLKSQSNAKFTPTSRFGIGILSCFMVADTVVVDTRRVVGSHSFSEPLNITIEGQESIFCIKAGKNLNPGTSTKLLLREHKNPWGKMSEQQFIESVERVAPNPPFKILIETENHNKTIDQNSFKNIKAESLKDYSWDKHENIREFNIDFNDRSNGFVGSVIVAVLEKHGAPVDKIEVSSKSIKIECEDYELEKIIKLENNEINLKSTSITINDDGKVALSPVNKRLAHSKSRISLHGIEVPTTLFPESWQIKNNQVNIEWPIPVLLVIDVCGNMDLDLNSSRTQIIKNEKWANFEDRLFSAILTGIQQQAEPDYWNKLNNILKRSQSNEVRNSLISDGEYKNTANPHNEQGNEDIEIRSLLDSLDASASNLIQAQRKAEEQALDYSNFPQDTRNSGWVKGWGVYRHEPWHFVGLFISKNEASFVLKDLGPDFQVAYGTHRVGSDDFVVDEPTKTTNTDLDDFDAWLDQADPNDHEERYSLMDFDVWLDQAEPDDHEEVYSLYRSVVDRNTFGIYKCSTKNGRYLVEADHVEDSLVLTSEKAKHAFLSLIKRRYCNNEDIELWYGFHRAMAKDD